MNNQHFRTFLKTKTILLFIFFSFNLFAQNYQSKANSLYEQEIYDEAFDYYELAIESLSSDSKDRDTLEARKKFCAEISMPIRDFEDEKYESVLRRLDKPKFTNVSGEANFLIGRIYLKGLGGISKDTPKAVSYLRKADELGHPIAASLIPNSFSKDEADDLLKKGNVENASNIYADLLSKDPGNKALSRAKEKCLLLSEARDKYRAVNYKEAIKVFNKYKDNALSYYYLGLMYKGGLGVEVDNCNARKYLTKANDLGFKQAKEHQSSLPVCDKSKFDEYKEDGDESFSAGEFQLAKDLYLLAQDESDNPEANADVIEQISRSEKLAEGVAQFYDNNFDSAMSMFEAYPTNKHASYYMAVMFYEGKGVEKNEKTAIIKAEQALPLEQAQSLLEEIRDKGSLAKAKRKYAAAVKSYNEFNLGRAVILCNEVLSLVPDNDSMVLLANNHLGLVTEIQEGAKTFASKDYEKAKDILSKHEKEPLPAYYLGKIYVDSPEIENLRKARDYFRVAYQLKFTDAKKEFDKVDAIIREREAKDMKYQELVSAGDELYSIGVFSEAAKKYKEAFEVIPENKAILIEKYKKADLANRGTQAYAQKDYGLSYKCLKVEDEQDTTISPVVLFYLGKMEYEGQGTTTNKEAGISKIEKACSRGYASACELLKDVRATRKAKFNDKFTKVWFGVKGGYGFTRKVNDVDLPNGISSDIDPGNGYSYQVGIALRFGNHAISLDFESLYGERTYISNYERSYSDLGGNNVNYNGTNTIKIQSLSNYALVSLHLASGFAVQGGGFYNANLSATQNRNFTIGTTTGGQYIVSNINRDYELLPNNNNINANLTKGDYGVSFGLLTRMNLLNIGARYDLGLAPFFRDNDFDHDLKWSQQTIMVYMGLYLKYKKKKEKENNIKE